MNTLPSETAAAATHTSREHAAGWTTWLIEAKDPVTVGMTAAAEEYGAALTENRTGHNLGQPTPYFWRALVKAMYGHPQVSETNKRLWKRYYKKHVVALDATDKLRGHMRILRAQNIHEQENWRLCYVIDPTFDFEFFKPGDGDEENRFEPVRYRKYLNNLLWESLDEIGAQLERQ